ncbi:hypothetical protein ACRAWD_20515 [Caulobacter segnis]
MGLGPTWREPDHRLQLPVGVDFFDTNSDNPHRNKTSSQGGALTAEGEARRQPVGAGSHVLRHGQVAVRPRMSTARPSSCWRRPSRARRGTRSSIKELRLVYDRGPPNAQGGIFLRARPHRGAQSVQPVEVPAGPGRAGQARSSLPAVGR